MDPNRICGTNNVHRKKAGKIVRTKRAFTLIERVIVVARVAILAAIPIPDFLEAQVRAKVSRAKTDMQTIAVAEEAYSNGTDSRAEIKTRGEVPHFH